MSAKFLKEIGMNVLPQPTESTAIQPHTSNVTVLSPTTFVMTKDFEGLTPENLERVKRGWKNRTSKRDADLDNVALILECEFDENLKEILGGWRGMLERLEYEDDEISQLWKVANVLARQYGIERLRATNTERRKLYEIALFAESLQEKRDCEISEAVQDAITKALPLKRSQITDLRFGRLDYDPITQVSLGALGTVPKGSEKKVKDAVRAVKKAATKVDNEKTKGKGFETSQTASLERLFEFLANPACAWLVESIMEFTMTSHTPEEFISILRKRLNLANLAKSEASDEQIIELLETGKTREEIKKTLGVGSTRVARVKALWEVSKAAQV
jgi:hypothetical protein